MAAPRRPARPRSILAPAVLAVAAGTLLVANLGIVPPSRLVWPALGILVGVLCLATAHRGDIRFVAGVILLGCFGLLLLSRLAILPGVRTLWPAFLAVVALAVGLGRWARRPRRSER